MKKILSLILTICMLSGLGITARAEDDIKVVLDGVTIEFDVPPQIVNDYTMVPMRAIFEALGYTVSWNQEDREASGIDSLGNTISMKINFFYIERNGKTIWTEAPAQIIDERTMVPVRALAEASNCFVDWDGDTRTVIIETLNYPETLVPRYEAVLRLWNVQPVGVVYAPYPGYAYNATDDDATTYIATLMSSYGYEIVSYATENHSYGDMHSFVLGNAKYKYDYVRVDICNELQAMLVTPVWGDPTPLVITSANTNNNEPQGNDVDFVDGILDVIPGSTEANKYKSKVLNLILDNPGLEAFLDSLSQSEAEELLEQAKENGRSAYDKEFDSCSENEKFLFAGTSVAISKASSAAYLSYARTLTNAYYNN